MTHVMYIFRAWTCSEKKSNIQKNKKDILISEIFNFNNNNNNNTHTHTYESIFFSNIGVFSWNRLKAFWYLEWLAPELTIGIGSSSCFNRWIISPNGNDVWLAIWEEAGNVEHVNLVYLGGHWYSGLILICCCGYCGMDCDGYDIGCISVVSIMDGTSKWASIINVGGGGGAVFIAGFCIVIIDGDEATVASSSLEVVKQQEQQQHSEKFEMYLELNCIVTLHERCHHWILWLHHWWWY